MNNNTNTNNRGCGPPQNPTIPAVVGVSQPSYVIPGTMPAGQVSAWQYPQITNPSGFSPIPGAPVASAFVPFPIPAQNPSFQAQPVSQPASQPVVQIPGNRGLPPGWIPYVNPPPQPYQHVPIQPLNFNLGSNPGFIPFVYPPAPGQTWPPQGAPPGWNGSGFGPPR
ncbi:hypothetical protein EDB80DRAFT_676281 [Ilyonectria destructans]|nr:hypothetical protein EDB80DRAFT_676281 [Ilyonectria destructans]